MPLNLDAVGIQSIATACVETFSLEKGLDESPVVMESDSGFKAAEAYNPEFNFSVKGRGDIPANWGDQLGEAPGDSIVDVNGGVSIITSITETENNEAHNEWEASGTNFPAAA